MSQVLNSNGFPSPCCFHLIILLAVDVARLPYLINKIIIELFDGWIIERYMTSCWICCACESLCSSYQWQTYEKYKLTLVTALLRVISLVFSSPVSCMYHRQHVYRIVVPNLYCIRELHPCSTCHSVIAVKSSCLAHVMCE